MLAGLKFGKKENEEKTLSKKDKKKEKRKEQKKRKKTKKEKKAAKEEVSEASSGQESEEEEETSKKPKDVGGEAPGKKVEAKASTLGEDDEVAKAEVDFFSSMGKEREKDAKLKEDPDKMKVSEKEYNPYLRGEESNLPVPKSASASSIPEHLRVGTPWAKNDWRKRLHKRQEKAVDGKNDEARLSPPRRPRTEPDESKRPEAPGRGPTGGGWRAAKRAAPQRSPSRSRSRRRSRSRGQSRSRKRQRARSSSKSRSSSSASAERRKEQVATAVLNRVKKSEALEDDADEIIRKLQSKYSKGGDSATSNGAEPAGQNPAKDVEEDIDPNKLGALAMEAMLSGDMTRYEELNRRLEKHQASLSAGSDEGNTFKLPLPEEKADNVKVLEQVDAAGRSKKLLETVQSTSVHTKGRNKRGNANAVPGGKDKKGSQGYYEDDEVSLGELIRRERIEGVQDYDANFEKHILKKGGKFKMLEEDEDEAYALGWYENMDKKMDARKGEERRLRQEKNDKNRIQVNLERCTLCMESKKFFRKDAIMSVSPHAYLCVEAQNRCIVPGQVIIVPQDHAMAMTDVDEAAWADVRNYQKCLVSFYESEQPPRAVLFVESSIHRVSRDKALLGAGPHCSIVAYPIEMDLLVQAKTYWKKAFDEAENEFETSHKKVIETDSKGGARTAVPKGFPYVHVDFSLGGGFVHVVDNVVDFPREFVQHVMAGMCELTILDRAYTCKEEYRDACKDLKDRFSKDFDWTKALQS